MSQRLEHFRTSIYKVPADEPLVARRDLVRAYCTEYQSHYIVESYLRTESSSFGVFKLEAVNRNGRRYPLKQDTSIPELHIEFNPEEKQELVDALPTSRKKPR